MTSCPYCKTKEKQIKAGKNPSGSQKYLCKACQRRYTPEPSERYGEDIRRQAVKLYVEGNNYRRIGRLLGIDHKTAMHWITAYIDRLPEAPQPSHSNFAELDELFSFVGAKKT